LSLLSRFYAIFAYFIPKNGIKLPINTVFVQSKLLA
jgi:hypothetical protein